MSKSWSAKDLASGAGPTGETLQTASDQDEFQQRDYDTLTDTWNHLKRRAEQLRRENEFLKKEMEQTVVESEEYVTFMSKRTQIRQNAIVALNEQNHQELERLRKERETVLQEHREQAEVVKKRILEKEKEISLLKSEITELSEFKNRYHWQQLERISELKAELDAVHSSQSKMICSKKKDSTVMKAQYENQAKHTVEAVTQAANREAVRFIMAQTQEVTQENQSLREELQQLIQRMHALCDRRDRLRARRQQLWLDNKCGQFLCKQRPRPEEGSAEPSAGQTNNAG